MKNKKIISFLVIIFSLNGLSFSEEKFTPHHYLEYLALQSENKSSYEISTSSPTSLSGAGYAGKGAGFTLEKIIGLAIKNSPTVKEAQANLENAQAKLMEARADFLPQLSLGSNYSRSQQTMSDFVGSIVKLPVKENYSYQFGLKQTIFDGLRTVKTNSQARNDLAYAEIAYGKAVDDVAFDVLQGYYTILKCIQMVEINKKMVEQSLKHREQAEANYKAGLATKSDILRSDVEVTNSKINLLKAENDLIKAKTSLNSYLNFPLTQEIIIEERKEPSIPKDIQLEEMLKSALLTRPEIKEMHYQKDSAKDSIAISRSNLYPGLVLSSSLGWREDKFPPETSSWSIGLGLDLPLFTGGANLARVNQAKKNLTAVEAREEKLKTDITLEVTQVYLSFKESQERTELTQKSLEQAELNQAFVEGKYVNGLANIVELVDADITLANAQISNAQAKWDLQINYLKLLKVSGMPFYKRPG